MPAHGAIPTFNSMTITTTRSSGLDTPAVSVTTRRLSFVACVLWLGVAASTAAWWDTTDDWRLWYGIYSLLLGSAAALTAASAISAAWRGSTESMETPGVALTGIAVCTTVIAWALPLWMLSIAIGYVVFATEAPKQRRAPRAPRRRAAGRIGRNAGGRGSAARTVRRVGRPPRRRVRRNHHHRLADGGRADPARPWPAALGMSAPTQSEPDPQAIIAGSPVPTRIPKCAHPLPATPSDSVLERSADIRVRRE